MTDARLELLATAFIDSTDELVAEVRRLRAFVDQVARVALRRPHDGTQLDEDLEGLLLSARELLEREPKP